MEQRREADSAMLEILEWHSPVERKAWSSLSTKRDRCSEMSRQQRGASRRYRRRSQRRTRDRHIPRHPNPVAKRTHASAPVVALCPALCPVSRLGHMKRLGWWQEAYEASRLAGPRVDNWLDSI
jgi:hypothetical protein